MFNFGTSIALLVWLLLMGGCSIGAGIGWLIWG